MSSESNSYNKRPASSQPEESSKTLRNEAAQAGPLNSERSYAHHNSVTTRNSFTSQQSSDRTTGSNARRNMPPVGNFTISPAHQEILRQPPPARLPPTLHSNIPPSMQPNRGFSGPPPFQNSTAGNAPANPSQYDFSPQTPMMTFTDFIRHRAQQAISTGNIGYGYPPAGPRPLPPAGAYMIPPTGHIVANPQQSSGSLIIQTILPQQDPPRPPPRGNFSTPPPFGSRPRTSPTILHYAYIDDLLDNVGERLGYAHARGNGRPRFMAIIDTVMTHHAQNRGSVGVFYSRDHATYGDDWLRWMVAGRMRCVLLLMMSRGIALTWEEEGVDEALAVFAYYQRLDERFHPIFVPNENEEKKRTVKAGDERKRGKRVGDRILAVDDLFPVSPEVAECMSEQSEYDGDVEDEEDPEDDQLLE